MHPRLLVLDEPTSALDPTAAEEVLATLTRLVHDLGVSVLLAEHRLERVVPFADRMCLLTGDGRVRVGEPGELLAESPVVPPIVELGRAAGWQPLPLTVRDARRLARDLAGGSAGRRPTAPAAPPALDRTRRHRDPRAHGRASASSTSPCGRGRVTALMGRNGSGKSSLLWALQGAGTRRSGAVRSATATRPTSSGADRRGVVGLLPQTAADLLYLETVDEECAAADGGPRHRREILDRLVPGIAGDRTRATCPRGSGWRWPWRWCWWPSPRSCCSTSRPAASTTPRSTRWPASSGGSPTTGRAVLVATHDVEFVAQAADDVVVLAEGEVVSSGPVRRVVAESPAFAPQVTKVLGPPWLRVDEVVAALETRDDATTAPSRSPRAPPRSSAPPRWPG